MRSGKRRVCRSAGSSKVPGDRGVLGWVEVSRILPRSNWPLVAGSQILWFCNDIGESRKSIAVGRFTAGVFHLMKIVESGMLELQVLLDGAPDPKKA
jgi:hypothetical protein